MRFCPSSLLETGPVDSEPDHRFVQTTPPRPPFKKKIRVIRTLRFPSFPLGFRTQFAVLYQATAEKDEQINHTDRYTTSFFSVAPKRPFFRPERSGPTHFRTGDHAPEPRLASANGRLPWERYLRLIRDNERTPRER